MAWLLSVTETMQGCHHFVDPQLGDASERLIWFRIKWGGVPSMVLNPLSPRFLDYDCDGVIQVDGLTPTAVPCKGSLHLDYRRRHAISYRLAFEVDGRLFRFNGEKRDVRLDRPWMLVKTHTTCYGELLDDKRRIISRSVLHFEPAMAREFLMSMRLSRA